MTNTISKMNDTPICYKVEEGVYSCQTIKVSCSDADSNVCKEELSIFTDNSPKASTQRVDYPTSNSSKNFSQCKIF